MNDNRSTVPILNKRWWQLQRSLATRVRAIAAIIGMLLLLSVSLTATAVARQSSLLPHFVLREVAGQPTRGAMSLATPPVAVTDGPTPVGRRWETIGQLAQEVGFTPLVPGYVPRGCSARERFSLPQFQVAYLTYSCVDLSQQVGKAASPPVGAGATEVVTIGNQPALYIRGAWVNYPPYPGNQFRGGTEWREDVAQELVLERNGLVIHLHAGPTSMLPKEELIRIAASLQPSK